MSPRRVIEASEILVRISLPKPPRDDVPAYHRWRRACKQAGCDYKSCKEGEVVKRLPDANPPTA